MIYSLCTVLIVSPELQNLPVPAIPRSGTHPHLPSTSLKSLYRSSRETRMNNGIKLLLHMCSQCHNPFHHSHLKLQQFGHELLDSLGVVWQCATESTPPHHDGIHLSTIPTINYTRKNISFDVKFLVPLIKCLITAVMKLLQNKTYIEINAQKHNLSVHCNILQQYLANSVTLVISIKPLYIQYNTF